MKQYIIILFFLSNIILGCKKPEDRKCWKSNGDLNTIVREVNSEIKNIHAYDKIDIRVIEDENKSKIEIEGPENLLNFISTEISSNILTIKDKNNCSFLRKNHKKIKVFIYTNSLTEFHNYGTGDININQTNTSLDFICELESSSNINITLQRSTLGVNLDGNENTNNINIYGQLNYLFIDNIGYGLVDTRSASINDIYIVNHSTQKTYLKALYNIDGVNYGTGDIYYNKDVINVNINSTNSGKLISY